MTYEVSLDGIPMRSACRMAEMHIVDVIELQPRRTTTDRERPGVPGSFVTRDHINSKQVRVQFALLTADQRKRTAALSEIAAWAMNGRCLEIGDRPGQQLRVVCTEAPISMSKRRWTDLCEMTFTAFSVPFWEDTHPVETTASAVTSADMTITPRGNVRQSPLSCRITPRDATLTTLRIAANGAEMAFSGLAVPAGKTLSIDYEEGVLAAKWTADDGTAVPCLKYRTGAEIIPLHARQDNRVSLRTDAAADITLCARGWYW